MTTGTDVAAPDAVAGGARLLRRLRQRERAARELLRLARYAGFGCVAVTAATHVLAGLTPIAFLIGIGVALQRLGEDPGSAAGWLGLALGAFVAQQALAPVQLVLS